MMSKRERLEATLAGEQVDRPAVSIWRHWPGDDQRAEDLAAAHLHWQRTYDFDFVKMMPDSDYCLRDWGIETAWLGGDEGTRTYQSRLIDVPQDWAALPVLDSDAPHLAEARRSVDLLRSELDDDVPVIMTIFSPLAQAKNLAGPHLLPHMRHHADQVMRGLQIVTDSVLRFVESLKPVGIDGIYYAVQLADAERLSRAEYEHFGRPWDLRILEAVSDLWFNVLHIHGLHTYFDLFSDYPVQVVNWHDRETGPGLAEGARLFPGAVSGGLNRWTTLRGTPRDVHQEAADAIAQMKGRRLILSTGCVTMTNTPLSNLRAARQAVEGSMGGEWRRLVRGLETTPG